MSRRAQGERRGRSHCIEPGRTGASPLVAPALGEVPRYRDIGRCGASRLAGMTLLKPTLNLNLRRWIAQDVLFELALEGLTAADQAYQEQ